MHLWHRRQPSTKTQFAGQQRKGEQIATPFRVPAPPGGRFSEQVKHGANTRVFIAVQENETTVVMAVPETLKETMRLPDELISVFHVADIELTAAEVLVE